MNISNLSDKEKQVYIYPLLIGGGVYIATDKLAYALIAGLIPAVYFSYVWKRPDNYITNPDPTLPPDLISNPKPTMSNEHGGHFTLY